MTAVSKDASDQVRWSLVYAAIDLSSRFGIAAFPATVGRTGEQAACLDDDAITARQRTETWRKDPMLAKFPDKTAPIEAAHPPAILRQFPP
jgi:hypothetical protein